jgi:hypothetical protein
MIEQNNFIDFRTEMQELKQLIGAKNTLTLSDTDLFGDLSKSHLYWLCMQRAIPHYKGVGINSPTLTSRS